MEHIRIVVGRFDFELACIRHHNKRREQGYATKEWASLEQRNRDEYREAMRYAWTGLIEVRANGEKPEAGDVAGAHSD